AWVHLSGITPALSPGCDELADHILRQAKHHGYLTSFDVNYRPALWTVSQAAPRLLELGNQAHTVLVGLDEARALWGCDTAEDVAALITRPLNLVVKDAAHEAV
ncbi:sugar kinase, partial [Arthrobacter deserti]|nr:sugar kinase [Arthrobacter deserti]